MGRWECLLLDGEGKSGYNSGAVLDGELAVPCSLQSATAGLNSCHEVRICGVWPPYGVLRTGSCATHACEPCQVLTEAALSGKLRVPRVCLVGATGCGFAWNCAIDDRCTAFVENGAGDERPGLKQKSPWFHRESWAFCKKGGGKDEEGRRTLALLLCALLLAGLFGARLRTGRLRGRRNFSPAWGRSSPVRRRMRRAH